MKIISVDSKMKQEEIAKELGYSCSTLQRYGQDIKMHSPKKSITFKKRQMTSNDLERPQMNSKEPGFESLKCNRKINLKGGNPHVDNCTEGIDLIEQVFSSQYLAEFIEIIKNDSEVQKELTYTIEKYNRKSYCTQSKVGQNALI